MSNQGWERNPKIIKEWISRVNDEARDLTKWETYFMESVTNQFDRLGYLSERQTKNLEKIYAEKTK